MNKPIDITGVVLQTERLTLRPWQETDLTDLYAYASVDGVGQRAGWNPHRSIEKSQKILDMFIQEKHTFALVYNGKVVGSLGVDEYSLEQYPELEQLQGREIGYVLARDRWSLGLMPEAVQTVIAWLFSEIKLDFIICGHFEWNQRSQRVIEKCGFQYIKTIKFETRYDTVENARDYILYHPERRNSLC